MCFDVGQCEYSAGEYAADEYAASGGAVSENMSAGNGLMSAR